MPREIALGSVYLQYKTQPEVLCPGCGDFVAHRILETFYGYTLQECSVCRLQFWNPPRAAAASSTSAAVSVILFTPRGTPATPHPAWNWIPRQASLRATSPRPHLRFSAAEFPVATPQ
jgi:hypothetical protein